MKIVVKDIVKKIQGQVILDHVNLVLESGKAYGIVGYNGSGKTMLIRSLAGLIEIDEGSFFLNDEKISRLNKMISIGLTIENVSLYHDMSLNNNLKYFSKISGKYNKENLQKICERVGLQDVAKKKVGAYSLGMKQRAVLAQALIDEPELLLLDEPTNGLDKEGKNIIEKLIRDEKSRGASVVVVSHDIESIKGSIDKWYKMEEGILTECSLEEVINKRGAYES